MKKYLNYIIFGIAVILLVFFLVIGNYKLQEYSSNLFYMDTYICVKVYGHNEEKAKNVLRDVDNIYKKYQELTDRYNSYKDVNNIYYINNNRDSNQKIKLDSELYNLIKYGIDWYDKSNKLLNINLGNIVDVWKKYRDNNTGIPTIEELKNSGSIDINDVVLLDDNYILNNHPNLDLGAIVKGYVTNKVGQYLKEKGYSKFLIDAGGNILVGDYYNKGKYKIGIEDPINPGDVYQVIEANNMAVVTSGGYERYYEYNKKLYHHIIDPISLMPPNYMKSVTVITPDSAMADTLSTILFLMPVEQGQEYIKKFSNVEAIWYINDNKIVKSSGFNKYE